MKHWMLAVGLLGATSARADEVDAPPRPAAPHNWSVGLGVGYSWLPTDGLLLQTALGSGQTFATFNFASLLPLMTFTAERRVAPTTWLTAALQGGYLSAGTTASSSSTKYVALGVGGRQVFNPGDFVEVSGFATLGFTDVQSGPAIVGLKLGPCVEYPFNEHLRLRFSATLVEASYEKEGEVSETGLFLTLQPNLALQIAF